MLEMWGWVPEGIVQAYTWVGIVSEEWIIFSTCHGMRARHDQGRWRDLAHGEESRDRHPFV